jgi:hypothetical protein
MWAVLERVRDLDLVLKGGTALAFTRGLNRHSTDLDFDTGRPVELRDRIDSAARNLGVNLEPARRQDWRDHQRFLARYPTPRRSEAEVFKVNVRYATPLRAEDIEVIGGIRSYKVPVLFDQKLAATASRIEARDLFDLAFVIEQYGDSLRDDQVRTAESFTEDLDRLEQRYGRMFEQDEVLRDVSDVEDTVLRFRYATTDQRDLRWPQVQEQGLPIPREVFNMVYAIRSRLRMASGTGTERQGTSRSVDQYSLRSPQDVDRERARTSNVDLNWSISR